MRSYRVSENALIADFVVQKILLYVYYFFNFVAVSFVFIFQGTSEPNIWAILFGLVAISSLIAHTYLSKRYSKVVDIHTIGSSNNISYCLFYIFSGREESVVWGIVSEFGIISLFHIPR